MAELSRSAVTFRIYGDDLDPNAVTEILGCKPSFSAPKNGVHTYPPKGRFRVAKTGVWRLKARDQRPGDLDLQIEEIFSALNQDQAIWLDLVDRYEVGLFCGLWLKNWNEGTGLSAKSLSLLGARGVPIDFDIYVDNSSDPENDGQIYPLVK